MSDDLFSRLAKRMQGAEKPRPEFVESLYADLAARLEAGQGSEPAGHRPEGDGSIPAVSLDPRPVAARPPRRPWRIAAVAAIAALLILGIPALLLRSAPSGPDPAATTVVSTTVGPDIVLEPGRPIGIGLEGPIAAYYVLYLPVGYDGDPLPLIVALGSESGGHSGGIGLWGPERADALGTAVISMAPTGPAWSYPSTPDEAARVPDTGAGSPPPVGSEDVTMIRTVLDDVMRRLAVTDVYVVGQYRGGLLAGRLACEIPERIDAVAGYPHAAYVPLDCDPATTAVPMMSIGPARSGDDAPYTGETAAEMLAGWAERSGCSETVSSPALGVTETRYTGCTGGARHLLTVVGEPAPEGWEDPVDAIWRFLTSAADAS